MTTTGAISAEQLAIRRSPDLWPIWAPGELADDGKARRTVRWSE